MLGVLEVARNPDIVTSALSGKGYLLPGVGRPSIDELAVRLKEYIRTCCLVTPEATDYLLPLIQLTNVFRPLHVFSTNYDVVIEQFIESRGLECVDGFELRFDSHRFDSRQADVLLYKLHGSATWFRSRAGSYLKLPIRSDLREITLLSGERAEPLMLYPAQKADYAGPFLELFRRFQDALRHAEWLVVMGYSFRDPIFRNLIVDALLSNPRLKIVMMCGQGTEGVFVKRLRSAVPGSQRGRVRDSGSVNDRIIRLPYRVEDALPEFVTSIFPALQRATAAHSASNYAELHGQPTQWNSAALEYLHAGVSAQAARILNRRVGPSTLQPEVRLKVLCLRSFARDALGDKRFAEIFWRQPIRTLQGWLSLGLRANLSLQPERRINFAMNYRRISEGAAHSIGYADGAKQLDEILRWGLITWRCLAPGERADSLSHKLVLLFRLSSYFKKFGDQGMDLQSYCRRRARWINRRTRELKSLLTAPQVELGPLNSEIQEFRTGLARAEWAYLRAHFLGGPALTKLYQSRPKRPPFRTNE